MKKIYKGILFLFLLSTQVTLFAMPSMLNYVPNCDTVPNKNLQVTFANYMYDFKGPFQNAGVTTNNSFWYGLEVGLKKAELGIDYLSNAAFVDQRSALYAGPVCYNFKYRLLTEGKDSFSLAIGAYNLGATKYNGLPFEFYYPSPYIIGTKTVRNMRFHLGYQIAILGYKNLDYDKKKNDGAMAGFDTVIIKSKNHPLTLMVDYFSGPMSCVNVGLLQPINSRLSWNLCSFHPLKQHLEPVQSSSVEFPIQYFLGLNYLIPFK
ncbi:MAG: hypothetical protein HQM08_26605 [Candidatus Riflebacteria bacterium]|nr:hypothetical protein [Candidatus Riflebacteria bacterium]